MTDLMSVLRPATPPEPKNARLVRGKMGNLQVDEPDEPKAIDALYNVMTLALRNNRRKLRNQPKGSTK